MTRLRDLGEWRLWERIFPRLASEGGELLVGPGDDAAVLAAAGADDIVLTADAMVEGIHFDLGIMSPADVGWRLTAASLSDLAAMGARPWAAVITLAAPGDTPAVFVEGFYEGSAALAAHEGLLLVGGDSVGSRRDLALSMTALGRAPGGRVLRRAGAAPGELVALTGELAPAAAGYDLLAGSAECPEPEGRLAALARFLRPVPRVAFGRALCERGLATAALDTSDSLAESAHLLARASGAAIVLEAEALPIAAAARAVARGNGLNETDYALAAGEDFELLFTFREEVRAAVAALAREENVALAIIGRVAAGEGVTLLRGGKPAPLPATGFRHF